jgi:hypothetical protein
MIPMMVCEVNKSFWKGAHTDLNTKFDLILKELDLYKLEYEQLYNETLPELISEYIEDNRDAMDAETLDTHSFITVLLWGCLREQIVQLI